VEPGHNNICDAYRSISGNSSPLETILSLHFQFPNNFALSHKELTFERQQFPDTCSEELQNVLDRVDYSPLKTHNFYIFSCCNWTQIKDCARRTSYSASPSMKTSTLRGSGAKMCAHSKSLKPNPKLPTVLQSRWDKHSMNTMIVLIFIEPIKSQVDACQSGQQFCAVWMSIVSAAEM
jgi:hypothetical protein